MRRLLIGLLISVPLVAIAGVETLCNEDERTLFTCTSKTKITSICASNTLSENNGYLRYAHGAKGHVEISYPEPHDLAKNSFKWFYGWSPGFISFLEFGIGKYTYYVYLSFGNGFSPPKEPGGPPEFYSWDVSGVAVFKDTALINTVKCGKAEEHFSEDDVITLLNATNMPVGNSDLLFDNGLP